MHGSVYHLWVDGVGGYLICLAPRVGLGQASANGSVDVPLLADVSRFHASILRDSEGYVVEAGRPLQVNGQLTQKVHVVGPDGRPVTAFYPMTQLPDGSWRIDGCYLQAPEEHQA